MDLTVIEPHDSAAQRPGQANEVSGTAEWPFFQAEGVYPADGGNDRTGQGTPVRRHRDRRMLWNVVVIAILVAGGTAGGVLASQAGKAKAPTAQRPAAESSQPPSELFSVLEKTARSYPGDLRMSSCVQQTTMKLQCTNPSPVIASLTFVTYASLSSLYANYNEIVSNLTGHKPASAVDNMNVCGATAPEPTGESTWNHSNEYSTAYSVNQLASGNVPTDAAMGRVFCVQQPSGNSVIVWTQNSGDLLGYATGGNVSHLQVWQWFETVHRNITFPVS